jgi:peptidoglycan-N-acetylglucosamine deacetylase
MTPRNLAKRILLSPFAVFSGPRRNGRVALTFDDGPHPEFTAPISKALRDAGARATFFLVGSAMKQHPQLVQRLLDDGHEIASHSMTHPEINQLPPMRFADEIDEMYKLALANNNGAIENRYFRPPKGVVTPRIVSHCARRDIKLIFWNRDPEDYKAQSPAEIVGYFDRQQPKAGDIFLLHDKTPHTVEAIPQVLARLAAQNLKPVTITELIASSPIQTRK